MSQADHPTSPSHSLSNGGHGHTRQAMDHSCDSHEGEPPRDRDFSRRAFTVGVGGPVGSGKTALLLKLCLAIRDSRNIAALTNDIFTKEDAELLTRHYPLPPDRRRAVETRARLHEAMREDVSANLFALESLHAAYHPDILLLECRGDTLSVCSGDELSDYTIQVMDLAGVDNFSSAGGHGLTQSDLLVINKTDLADAVGVDLAVVERDTQKMRGAGPYVLAQVKHGIGVDAIAARILHAWQQAMGKAHDSSPTEGMRVPPRARVRRLSGSPQNPGRSR